MVAMWVIALAISVAVSVVSMVLMPQPKQPRPDAARDLDNPTAEAGRPIPVIFGTITIKGGNILDFRDKSTTTYQITL